MRNMLAFLAAVALTVIGVGWYLDWYKLRTAPSSDGQRSVTVDIDTKKISADLQKGADKVQQKLAEKAKQIEEEKKKKEAKPEPKLPTVEVPEKLPLDTGIIEIPIDQ